MIIIFYIKSNGKSSNVQKINGFMFIIYNLFLPESSLFLRGFAQVVQTYFWPEVWPLTQQHIPARRLSSRYNRAEQASMTADNTGGRGVEAAKADQSNFYSPPCLRFTNQTRRRESAEPSSDVGWLLDQLIQPRLWADFCGLSELLQHSIFHLCEKEGGHVLLC